MTRDQEASAGRRAARSMLGRSLIVAGCAALLAGCMSDNRMDLAVTGPADYRLRHPIVVKEKAKLVRLFVGNNSARLTPNQRAQIRSFAQEWRREATGGVIIDVPKGSRNAAAAAGASAEAHAMLVADGVPTNVIAVHRYRVPDPQLLATVQLSYPRMAAEAGPCGQWPADLGSDSLAALQNKPYWNLGCASQRNLAAMVADPSDLVQPRGETPASAERRSNALQAYQRGDQTTSKWPDNSAAKISDVGK